MSTFVRGAHLRGNTEVPVVNVPRITGTVRRDSSGDVPSLPLPSTLRVESDLGAVSVTFTTSRALNDVISALNAALTTVATAEDRDGCLSLASLTAGNGGYIRIKASTSGFADAAAFLGFRVDPHPLATVSAGDVERAEVRPALEANPERTAFVPYGADRTPRAFNRGLLRLARNLDHLYARLTNPVAVPITLDIDATDAAWASRLTLDADDNVVQLDLSDLAGIDPVLAGRVYVGGLDANSSLAKIGGHFKVLDTDDNEIVAADSRVVRVAAVTRGARVAPVPTFADDWSAPTGALSDTSSVTPDGGNALGVDLVKAAPATISAIPDRATISVAGAAYVTDGVVPGDIVTITGSTIDAPVSHNGAYIVEVVVSEEELVIRAQSADAHGDLNLAGGDLGDAAVSTGGEFQDGIWLTFDPPIPPQQLRGGTSFKVVFGLEKSLGFVSEYNGLLLKMFARSSAEVDGFAMRDIRRQMNFGGVYDGQAPRTATGAGGFGSFTRPASLRGVGDGRAAAGTLVRAETGGSTSGHYLTAAAGDEFTSDDVGRLFFLTVSTFNGLPCLAVQLDGNQRIMLRRLDASEDGTLPTDASVNYEVRADAAVEFPALLQARSVADGSTTRGAGFAALHEVTDTGAVSHKDLGWYGLASLERVVVDDSYANLLGTAATLGAAGTDTLATSFDPTAEPALFAPENDALTAGTFSPHATLVRIFDGADAGWYRAQELLAANSIRVVHLDGSPVTFTVGGYSARVGFYNIAFATNVPLADGKWAAGRFFADWHQVGPEEPQDGVLSVGWRGGDENAAGVKIHPNDLDGVGGAGKARGWGVYLVASAPMTGAYRAEAFDQTVAIALASTPGATAFPDYTGVLEQGLGFFGSAAGLVGRGPGLTMLASLWMGRSSSPGATTWDDGAFLTEAAAGLGRAAYPVDVSATESYLGGGSFQAWDAPTRLGHPAVLYPATTGATETADIEEPDLAQFAMPHSGILDISGMVGHHPTSLLGCRVEILDGASVGQVHRVIAVSATKAALEGAADIAADETGAEVTVYGARWREVHGDIADWMQVGTRFLRGDEQEAPLVTLGRGAGTWADEPAASSMAGAVTWVPTALTGTMAAAGTTVTGVGTAFLSEVVAGSFFKMTLDPTQWRRVRTVVSDTALTLDLSYDGPTAGPGASAQVDLGRAGELARLDGLSPVSLGGVTGVGYHNTSLAAIQAMSADAWAGGWQTDLEEPQAPIPNVGVSTRGNAVLSTLGAGTVEVPAGARMLDAYYPGSLNTDEAALEVLQQESVAGPRAAFSTRMGGCLAVFVDEDALGDADLCRVWFRGTRGMTSRFGLYKVRIVLQSTEGQVQCWGSFRNARTGAVVFAAQSIVVLETANVAVHEVEFGSDAFLTDPYDSIREGAVEDSDVCFCLDVALSDTPAQGSKLFIGQVLVEDRTQAMRHYGPVEVMGAHRAHAYRLSTPAAGFDAIGPSRVDLLEFNEIARAEQLADQAENDESFVEGQGIGAVKVSTNWGRPILARQNFFKKGPSAAVIRGVQPFFDPLWYAYVAGISTTAPGVGAYSALRPTIVYPGRTGFYAEVRAPHGSMLQTLHATLSFVPCYARDLYTGDGNDTSADFQVWHDYESNTSSAVRSSHEAALKSSWDADEGVRVRLYRRHLLGTGVPGAETGSMAGSPPVPEAGYSELIWEKIVDLSGVTEPGELHANGYGGEHTVYLSEDLTEAADLSNLRVDLRHFEYVLTVEFWIGARDSYDDAGTDRYLYTGGGNYWVPCAASGTARTVNGFEFHGLLERLRSADTVAEGPSAQVPSPPEVKFRGARVGWVTDRAFPWR